MDQMLSPDNIKTFLFFVVPGIIALYIRAQFMAGRIPPISEGIVAYATVSLVYHALAYPLAASLYSGGDISGWLAFWWFVLIIVGPASLGLILGLNVKRGWMKALLARAGIATVHPVDCAWDWHFSTCKESWVLVVLKDGTKWGGFLGKNSFMSSSNSERDMFIEKVYEIRDDSPWEARTSSVWIAQGEIQSIEFWPNT